MTQVTKNGILLQKTQHSFENEGVINPGVIEVNGKIHLFYRAVSSGNYSSIGYCKLNGPMSIEERRIVPVIFPQFDHEMHGVEDPRIVKIEDLFYLSYTSYDGYNALGALAISSDLIRFDKLGVIVPQITFEEFNLLAPSGMSEKYFRLNELESLRKPDHKKLLLWDKNLIFFPRKINGHFYFLHRIKPDIQVVAIEHLADLTTEFWRNYITHLDEHILLSSKHPHEESYVGGGCPPIETDQGWLLIYHGVHDSRLGYIYSACAALMDIESPQKEIARLPFPLFSPEYKWELAGEVNNVCFPTGCVRIDDELHIYYGAADEQIACATLNINELIQELLLYSNKNDNSNILA